MPGGTPGDGAFPVSHSLGWHGGMHIAAPAGANGTLPVRAIADGTVVYTRMPTPQPAGPLPTGHPLTYRGGWTDNGVVVLRHETEIGEGETARVVFFSIYAHLRSIDPAVQQGRAVYRKALLGTPGQIYGDTDAKIHFEIISDDVNARRLAGRSAGEVPLTQNGRTDAVFGELYFFLPSGTPVYPQEPLWTSSEAMVRPGGAPNGPAQPLAPAFTTTQPFIAGIRFSEGRGGPGRKGDAHVALYRTDGTLVAPALLEEEAEYLLYNKATQIAEASPPHARPTVSATYELLRFGRMIGPDVLNPATLPHWRRVQLDGLAGWVNLNAANVMRYSDADMPHWRGWTLIDDSQDQDSRCDSPTIRALLDQNADGVVSASECQALLSTPRVTSRLSRLICKFPTEWNAATFEQRWSWLRTPTPENPNALSDADFEELRAHVSALAFWPGGTQLSDTHWHWPPREFIKAFRHCAWLSANELAQLLPRQSPLGATPWGTAQGRAQAEHVGVSKLFRKYTATSTNRKIHFLSQIYIETGLLRTMREGGQGAPNPAIPKAQHYAAFYGRGYMQLTWASNYEKYGVFRGLADHAGAYADARITQTSTHVWQDFEPPQQPQRRRWSPRYDPDLVATDVFCRADSGGYYWVSKRYRGTSNIHRVADLGSEPRYVGFISWLVNGGGNGYAERQAFARYLESVLGDMPRQAGIETWAYPRLSAQITGAFPPGNSPNTQSVLVNHAPQIP